MFWAIYTYRNLENIRYNITIIYWNVRDQFGQQNILTVVIYCKQNR